MQQGWAPLDLAGDPVSTNKRVNKIKRCNETISVIQINLNKSNHAQLELTHTLKKTKHFICVVSEPDVIKNKLSSIPTQNNVLPTERTSAPRATIFTSKTIPIYEITSPRHRDMVVGLMSIKNKTVAIICAYMDIKCQPVPAHISEAVEYSKQKGYGILLGGTLVATASFGGIQQTPEGVNGKNALKKNNLAYTIRGVYQHMKAR